MNFVPLAPVLLALSLSSTAGAADPPRPAAPTPVETERPVGTAEVRAEADRSLQLARDGVYGPLKRGDLDRIEAARDSIDVLLEGHDSIQELTPEAGHALHQAQEVIRITLRKEDRNRIVCQRGVQTGTRLGSTECLTVAQREQRAAAAKEGVDKVQRNICYPGEGQDCR
jgi:hypothetical protein